MSGITSSKQDGSQEGAATRTHCDLLHQYHGSEFCQTRCTLTFAHDGPHICAKGHQF